MHHHTTMNMFSRYSRIAHPSNHIVNKQAINPCSIVVDQSLSIFFHTMCTWTFFFFIHSSFFHTSRDIPFLPLWNGYSYLSFLLDSFVTGYEIRVAFTFFFFFLFLLPPIDASSMIIDEDFPIYEFQYRCFIGARRF